MVTLNQFLDHVDTKNYVLLQKQLTVGVGCLRLGFTILLIVPEMMLKSTHFIFGSVLLHKTAVFKTAD